MFYSKRIKNLELLVKEISGRLELIEFVLDTDPKNALDKPPWNKSAIDKLYWKIELLAKTLGYKYNNEPEYKKNIE